MNIMKGSKNKRGDMEPRESARTENGSVEQQRKVAPLEEDRETEEK